MKLQPVGRALLVQFKEEERKGVILVTRQQDEPMQATIIGVGEKCELPIKEGDCVLLMPYCGMKAVGGSKDAPYMIVGEKDVIGILKD
jgi:co-chaperonin GroES (HSP10)